MSLRQRVRKVERVIDGPSGRCPDCGKSRDDWQKCLVLRQGDPWPPEAYGCATCGGRHKLYEFDDELYESMMQEEAERERRKNERMNTIKSRRP